ncbi:hypothetical protein [Streptomyces mirabilis]
MAAEAVFCSGRCPCHGHPEKWPRREIVDGIRYIVDNGAKWRVWTVA